MNKYNKETLGGAVNSLGKTGGGTPIANAVVNSSADLSNMSGKTAVIIFSDGIDNATDLDLIAKCAGVRNEEVRQLNPALLRGASPPDMKGYPVRVPQGTGKKAEAALRRVPSDKRLTWRRHRVERGKPWGTSRGVTARASAISPTTTSWVMFT